MASTLLLTLPAALKTKFDTALAGQNVSVYDGPPVAFDIGDLLFVGLASADNENDNFGGSADQDWSGLGNRTREERGSISCLLATSNGNSDVPAARARAIVIADLVAAALRADPTLGGTVSGLMWVGFGGRHNLEQFQADDGAGVFYAFEIAFYGRP